MFLNQFQDILGTYKFDEKDLVEEQKTNFEKLQQSFLSKLSFMRQENLKDEENKHIGHNRHDFVHMNLFQEYKKQEKVKKKGINKKKKSDKSVSYEDTGNLYSIFDLVNLDKKFIEDKIFIVKDKNKDTLSTYTRYV